MAPVRASDFTENRKLAAAATCVAIASACRPLKRTSLEAEGVVTDLAVVQCKRLRLSGATGMSTASKLAASRLPVTHSYRRKPNSVPLQPPRSISDEDRAENFITGVSRVCCTSSSASDSGTVVALDCEFVGIAGGMSALGRCSIVDSDGVVLLDIYSRPDEPILDYRTPWSGITPRHMINAIPFDFARRKIKNLIKNKIVVGHAVHNDFRVLNIRHPRHLVRDTSTSPILNKLAHIHKGPASLKSLSQALLGRRIQVGSHCSVEDARAAMSLYKLAVPDWENSMVHKAPRTPVVTVEDDEKSFLEDEYWPNDLSYDTR